LAGAATSPSRRPLPPSFREIQSRRRRASRILFTLLVLFYFAAFQLLWLTFKTFFLLQFVILHRSWLTWRDLAMVGSISVVAAALHWWGAMWGGTERILEALGARRLDPDDRLHRQLENVVREMEIAAGTSGTEIRVVDHTSVNAFAVTDSSGRSTLGVTEGLLAALDRNRLQAVVAHEMTHIREGDTLLATMACSLFGVFAQMLESLRNVNREERESRLDLMMPVLWLITLGAYLLNVAVSRQRESLADAGAVELTRNPLALAEALHVMGRRGADHLRRELGALFMVSPAVGRLDEREGRLADLFSTHPPLRRRIIDLLRMARRGYGSFDERMRAEDLPTGGAPGGGGTGEPSAEGDGGAIPGAASVLGGTSVDPAALLREFTAGGRRSEGKGRGDCPSCGALLRRRDYEGIELRECASCGGKLLRHGQDYRVMSRREERFGTELHRLAESFEKATAFRPRPGTVEDVPPRRCPDCGGTMRGQYYSYQFFLRVDRCARCTLTWFDPYELELLQVMVEQPRAPFLPPEIDGGPGKA
jgi:heat shock protein HtpX